MTLAPSRPKRGSAYEQCLYDAEEMHTALYAVLIHVMSAPNGLEQVRLPSG